MADRCANIVELVSACLLALAADGCATIVQGTTETLVVESTPPGARVTIEPGGLEVVTPGEVVLERGSKYRLRFERDGFEPTVDEVFPQADGTTAGNLVVGGIIGLNHDLESGAAFGLFPNPVHVHLSPIPVGANAPKDKAAARIVFFNTSNPAHADRNAVAVALDGRHLATLAPYGQVGVAVSPGLHSLRLRHREVMVFDDEYELEIASGITYIAVFSRAFSTKFERLDAPPDGFSESEPAPNEDR